eukprot:TRINITY_DN791_c0_g1_i1.p1 TRINITY_DN791_c0_g1~~TRINITY_DN791_c0_g1_i1.p1  ORF type:complete len:439 (+),score=35.37 TRINITY_DN791_c0_g1_i1:508-1824(+)
MEVKGNMLMKKYELAEVVGKGTFAKVYHAKNTKTGESVAIKAMDKEKILKVGMIDQIKREISIMRLVRHPNIVQLHEVMASKSKIYFVMEYVKRGELFFKVSKGKLTENEARKYFQQLISAVDFCHSRGVYHRDLKPENLLIDNEGNLKISDFGLSALREQLHKDGLLHTTCGTPAYVAPEVITRKGYDGSKADIWSCGVILFVLLAGYLPFQDTNLMIMYRKIYKGDFKCPPWFSADVRKLIIRLLDPNPSSRITIPQILENPWFRRGFRNPLLSTASISASLSPDIDVAFEGDDHGEKPACLNAFDIISLSPSFDLSGLFDRGMKQHSRFISTEPASDIVSKLENLGKNLRLDVKRSKDCKLRLQSTELGRKGRFSIDAEVFQVTASLFLIDLHKASGDTLEFNAFLNRELRPALKEIVYAWDDDSSAPANCSQAM